MLQDAATAAAAAATAAATDGRTDGSPPLCHVTAGGDAQLSRAVSGELTLLTDRRVQPFKETHTERRGERGELGQTALSLWGESR